MSQELIYTSAPRGLKPGTRGFCTVVSTQQMSQPLAERLESLSGYRHLFAAHDVQAKLNPVIHSHLILTIGGRKSHVLSRIADAGLDYTQRSNKFAHHVVLDAMELPPGGPAWLLSQPGFMQTEWDGEPKLLPSGRRPAAGFDPPTSCRRWQELTGDAGWGGVLAETATGALPRPACIFFRSGQDLLPLVAESLALLPLQQRWGVTFSTWFTKLPPGVECQWRFLLADSPEAKQARRQHQALLIDLTVPLPNAGSNAMVQAARTGVVIAALQTAGPSTVVSQAGQRHQDAVVAASDPQPVPTVVGEYGMGPPPVVDARLPVLPVMSRKKRRRLTFALVSIAASMLITAAVLIALIAVGVGGQKTSEGQRPSNDSASTPQSAGQKEDDTEADNTMTVSKEQNDSPTTHIADASAGSDLQEHAENHAEKTADATFRKNADAAKDGVSNAGDSSEPVAGKTAAKVEMAANVEKPAANPLDELPSQLELPAVNQSSEVATLPDFDVNGVELELIGWDQLTGRSLKYRRELHDSTAEWTINEELSGLATVGGTKPIGTFSLSDGHLLFKWGTASNSGFLRSCLLRVNIKQAGAGPIGFLRPLRVSRHLDRSAISFDDVQASIPLILDGLPDETKQSPLRLEIMLTETAKPAAGGTPRIDPPSGNVPINTTATATSQFDPGGSVVVEAHLAARKGTQPAIQLKYRWRHKVIEPGKGFVDKDMSLSIPRIIEHKRDVEKQMKDQLKRAKGPTWVDPLEQASEKLTRAEKDYEQANRELKELEKKGNDADKSKREMLEHNVKKLQTDINAYRAEKKRFTEERSYLSQEPARCDHLVEFLNGLREQIRLRVYYQFGSGDDKAMQVTLAETAEE